MKFDRPLFAIVICIIPLIPIEIFTQIMKYWHLTTVSALEAMSMLWLPEGSWPLGILGILGVSTWLGLAIYYSAKIWGTDYFPIKASILTMTAESLVFNVFGVLGRNQNLIQGVSGNLVHAGAAAAGGALIGFLMKKYAYAAK